MPNLTQAQLDRMLAKWQRVLRLQDWDFKIEIKRFREMDQSLGRTKYRQKFKDATIHVMSPVDADPDADQASDNDSELTMVHELLHMHFAPFYVEEETNKLVHNAQELAIETIARALISLDRARKS